MVKKIFSFEVPIHDNDKILFTGDIIFFCWTVIGLLGGVPLWWGLTCLCASMLSMSLMLFKYKDIEWKNKIKES